MSYNDFSFDYDYVAPKDRVELMSEGEGTFRIHEVVQKVSKSSGNSMLEVMFKVRDVNGREWHIYEYLIAPKPYNKELHDENSYEAKSFQANLKRLNTKIGNIAKAIGRADMDSVSYNKKQLAQDLLGASGKCYVKIQEDKTGQYSDKNVIAKFYPIAETAEANAVTQIDDDLPF